MPDFRLAHSRRDRTDLLTVHGELLLGYAKCHEVIAHLRIDFLAHLLLCLLNGLAESGDDSQALFVTHVRHR